MTRENTNIFTNDSFQSASRESAAVSLVYDSECVVNVGRLVIPGKTTVSLRFPFAVFSGPGLIVPELLALSRVEHAGCSSCPDVAITSWQVYGGVAVDYLRIPVYRQDWDLQPRIDEGGKDVDVSRRHLHPFCCTRAMSAQVQLHNASSEAVDCVVQVRARVGRLQAASPGIVGHSMAGHAVDPARPEVMTYSEEVASQASRELRQQERLRQQPCQRGATTEPAVGLREDNHKSIVEFLAREFTRQDEQGCLQVELRHALPGTRGRILRTWGTLCRGLGNAESLAAEILRLAKVDAGVAGPGAHRYDILTLHYLGSRQSSSFKVMIEEAASRQVAESRLPCVPDARQPSCEVAESRLAHVPGVRQPARLVSRAPAGFCWDPYGDA